MPNEAAIEWVQWCQSPGPAVQEMQRSTATVPQAGAKQVMKQLSVSFLISSWFLQPDKLYAQVQSSLFQIFNWTNWIHELFMLPFVGFY
jgi:hypothetical protein